jgi:hypothetical protein
MPIFWTRTLNAASDNKQSNPRKLIYDTTRDTKGDDIHWKLSLVVRHEAKVYENYSFRIPSHENGLLTSEVNESCGVLNYVAANIGFIVSDVPIREDKSHGRRFITFPISINDYDFCTWKGNSGNRDRFNEADFARNLNRRNKTSFNPDTVGRYTLTDYYHGEQALVNHMETAQFFDWLIFKLSEAGIRPGHKIYGVVLDIHSSREVCPACQQMLEYLMSESSNNGFLYWLQHRLNREGYLTSRRHPLYMTIRISADMRHGYNSSGAITSVTEHKDEKTPYSTSGIGLCSHSGTSWLLQRHDHRVFFEEKLLNREVRFADIRQTIFCSGSWVGTRIPLRGCTSLSRLWPEYPYQIEYLKPIISAASNLISSPVFNKSERDIPLLVAEYLVGDQVIKKIKTEVSKIEPLKPSYNSRDQEFDTPLLIAEYAYEEPAQEQKAVPRLTS